MELPLTVRLMLVALLAAGSVACNVDDENECPVSAFAREPVCDAALRFAARASEGLVPTQSEALRYITVWRAAVAAEPVLYGRLPQFYRNRSPSSATIWTTNATVIEKWSQGILVTEDPVFDSIVADLPRATLGDFYHENSDGSYYFLLMLYAVWNEDLADARLRTTSSWLNEPTQAPGDDGTWTWMPSDVPGAHAKIDFVFGWGDCMVACDGEHQLRVIVDENDRVTVFDLGGDPLPAELQLSPQTQPWQQ